MRLQIVFSAMFVLPCSILDAAQLVVPNAFTSVEGDGNNSYPFNVGHLFSETVRYQQVYGSGDFDEVTDAALITQMAFRPDSRFGNPFSTTIPNIEIYLSTTANGPDELSLNFAENAGTDETLVYSGELILSSEARFAINGSKRFDILIEFHQPFYYDPAFGDLLLEVKNFSDATTDAFDSHSVVGDSVSRLYADDANSSTGLDHSLASRTAGLITQFTFDQVPVRIPEPNTITVAAVATIMSLSFRANRSVSFRSGRD